MSDQPGAEQGAAPTEDELRAALEQQLKQIRVEQLVLENVVTLLNLGMRRAGLSDSTEEERDPDQVRLAIESVRALLPVLDQVAPQQVRQIRDALSQLQLAFVRIGGAAEAPAAGPSEGGEPADQAPPEPSAPKSGQPGPAQRSGRLWVPGQ